MKRALKQILMDTLIDIVCQSIKRAMCETEITSVHKKQHFDS